jgi:hypothetical protein
MFLETSADYFMNWTFHQINARLEGKVPPNMQNQMQVLSDLPAKCSELAEAVAAVSSNTNNLAFMYVLGNVNWLPMNSNFHQINTRLEGEVPPNAQNQMQILSDLPAKCSELAEAVAVVSSNTNNLAFMYVLGNISWLLFEFNFSSDKRTTWSWGAPKCALFASFLKIMDFELNRCYLERNIHWL